MIRGLVYRLLVCIAERYAREPVCVVCGDDTCYARTTDPDDSYQYCPAHAHLEADPRRDPARRK